MPEVSDATGSGPGGFPINTVRRANTVVRVRDGETIIIGGMTYETRRRLERRVPILSEIPLIGGLFRFFRNEERNTEVIIMVTPRILRDDDDEDAALEDKAQVIHGNGPSGGAVVGADRALPKINLNSAGFRDLETLPGIDRTLANRIVAHRQDQGPFRRVEDLLRVRGIDQAMVEILRLRVSL
jgi:competence ComEA-like helix-hairpin-helix protein